MRSLVLRFNPVSMSEHGRYRKVVDNGCRATRGGFRTGSTQGQELLGLGNQLGIDIDARDGCRLKIECCKLINIDKTW
jgi:hypothetical protein